MIGNESKESQFALSLLTKTEDLKYMGYNGSIAFQKKYVTSKVLKDDKQ